jgi:hypothetical protein
LQKGKWHGKQIVPAEWIEAATTRQTSNGSNPNSDWDQGYGYQFWRCRHGAYRGDGAFGQYCIVMPDQDAVVAITSGVRDMQAVLNLVWDKLLPALKPTDLAVDDAAAEKLKSRLNELALRTPQSTDSRVDGASRRYTFEPNDSKLESIAIERGDASGHETVVARIGGSEQRIVCGRGKWHAGNAAWGPLKRQPAAAAGGWANDTFTAKICFYETPFLVTIKLKFSGDEVTVNAESNVGFGNTRQPELVGKLAAQNGVDRPQQSAE